MNAVITKIRRRPSDWITKDDVAELLHCDKRTVDNILKEMEALDRYEFGVTSQIGKCKLIDRLALNDYVRNRKRLKNKNLAKHVEPYDPIRQAQLLGYYEEKIEDDVA